MIKDCIWFKNGMCWQPRIPIPCDVVNCQILSKKGMRMEYKEVARKIVDSKEPGSELFRLLEAVDFELDESDAKFGIGKGRCGILIIQSVPCKDTANPIIQITIFANTESDFPAHDRNEYVQFVKEHYEWIQRDEAWDDI